ncbi:MAG: hypothetical protein SFX72_08470 [Isosphaeraceae bacterium]|nr:hypothetical protein [Isosphaeraceae bacterium]
MIRTGYLRWEIEVDDDRCEVDREARVTTFLARPTYRTVLVKNHGRIAAAEKFVRGEESYDAVVRTSRSSKPDVALTIPDVGPRPFRYSESDRLQTPRFWMEKLHREANAFAHEVVRAAASFPQLVISSPALRAGYARMVEHEIFRVIEGRSSAGPTLEEPMRVDEAADSRGVPELVAAELVRDVVDPAEFDEFCRFDRVTIKSGKRIYRIPRRPHALIEVWNAQTLQGEARLCVVFQDPGMPPSDEVVMKYLLAKHQPEMLWEVGIKFSAPTGRFETGPPRRWRNDQ